VSSTGELVHEWKLNEVNYPVGADLGFSDDLARDGSDLLDRRIIGMFFGREDKLLHAVTPYAILSFDTITGEVLRVNVTIPDILGANLHDAVGIHAEVAKQLSFHGALV
jgi:hypothetical protein